MFSLVTTFSDWCKEHQFRFDGSVVPRMLLNPTERASESILGVDRRRLRRVGTPGNAAKNDEFLNFYTFLL